MRNLIISIIVVLPTLATARVIEDTYAEMRAAADRCENAWFDRSRERALEDLESATIRLITMISPLSRDFERQLRYLEEANHEFEECAKRVYGGDWVEF